MEVGEASHEPTIPPGPFLPFGRILFSFGAGRYIKGRPDGSVFADGLRNNGMLFN